jgi:hypothetical protein
MRYFLSQNFKQLAPLVREWTREGHSKPILTDFRSQTEVRLMPIPDAAMGLLPPESRPGCTISLHAQWVLVHCDETCRWIEAQIVKFLRKRGLIGEGEPVTDCPMLKRRVVVHDHQVGRPVSDQVRARARAEREAKRASKPRRFRTVIEAVLAAIEQVGGWVVLTQRTLDSAKKSQFRDPDYIFELIVDLGAAAEQNAKGGLSGTWLAHLGANGGHDFVANTSKNTVEMYHAHYHVLWDGHEVCIGAHVRCGNGSAQALARVYLSIPLKPGGPVILGHIGSHLPLPK